MMQHTGRPVAGPSGTTTVINRSKAGAAANVKGRSDEARATAAAAIASSSSAGSAAETGHHHHHSYNNNNNNTIKTMSGGAGGGSSSAAATAINEFKTKTVLKEAVDAVVSSFAKHSQGYGRGELLLLISF